MAERLADELQLTPEQRAQWKESVQREAAEMKPLRENASLSKEERRAQAVGIHKRYRDERAALLTPEQRTKFDQFTEKMERRRERFAERREKSGDK